MSTSRGYLYILYNDIFKSYSSEYSSEVYKLGRTNNCETRLKHYTTSYIQPSSFLYTSKQFDNAVYAERILFYLLRYYRIRDKREFFTVDLYTATETIKRIESYTSDQISTIYKHIHSRLFPDKIISKIDENDEEYDRILNKSIDEVCRSLERFRFKPKHPEHYKSYQYISREEQELIQLEYTPFV